mmetsp:Transcript_71721/g.207798  ORF Transcript_71721/g.207798 Transcript_71721/m.207798 type:complete len:347 (-) Transcript_71721:711-1751(-)
MAKRNRAIVLGEAAAPRVAFPLASRSKEFCSLRLAARAGLLLRPESSNPGEAGRRPPAPITWPAAFRDPAGGVVTRSAAADGAAPLRPSTTPDPFATSDNRDGGPRAQPVGAGAGVTAEATVAARSRARASSSASTSFCFRSSSSRSLAALNLSTEDWRRPTCRSPRSSSAAELSVSSALNASLAVCACLLPPMTPPLCPTDIIPSLSCSWPVPIGSSSGSSAGTSSPSSASSPMPSAPPSPSQACAEQPCKAMQASFARDSASASSFRSLASSSRARREAHRSGTAAISPSRARLETAAGPMLRWCPTSRLAAPPHAAGATSGCGVGGGTGGKGNNFPGVDMKPA